MAFINYTIVMKLMLFLAWGIRKPGGNELLKQRASFVQQKNNMERVCDQCVCCYNTLDIVSYKVVPFNEWKGWPGGQRKVEEMLLVQICIVLVYYGIKKYIIKTEIQIS